MQTESTISFPNINESFDDISDGELNTHWLPDQMQTVQGSYHKNLPLNGILSFVCTSMSNHIKYHHGYIQRSAQHVYTEDGCRKLE